MYPRFFLHIRTVVVFISMPVRKCWPGTLLANANQTQHGSLLDLLKKMQSNFKQVAELQVIVPDGTTSFGPAVPLYCRPFTSKMS